MRLVIVCVLAMVAFPITARAQEQPYFVTYDSRLEDVGDLEISLEPVFGRSDGIRPFVGGLTEFEYGLTGWWTTEFYIDWQHTDDEGGAYTGFRFEHRFRPFRREHRVDPVLYVEYEHLSDADKTLKEIVGFDGKADLAVPTSEVRHDFSSEIETKLILSSHLGHWRVSENIIAEKNLTEGGPWEFGYALGVNRPLAASKGQPCVLCREAFTLGIELYGGLGTQDDFTFEGTSHYLAPVLAWDLGHGTLLRVSPTWGLTDESVGHMIRIGVSHEIEGVGHALGRLFGND